MRASEILEFVTGLLIALVGLAAAAGLAEVKRMAPVINLGVVLAVAAAGAAMFSHALYRRARRVREPDLFWLRACGLALAATSATLALAIALPLWLAPLGLFKIGGFPLGYYAAAELVPILLVVLAFWQARAMDRLDDPSRPESDPS